MSIADEISQYAAGAGAEVKGKKGSYTLKRLVAERKAFLSRKKLEYIAYIKINEEQKEVKFAEMLKESGSGLSSGGDPDDMSSGFGFKTQTYKSGMSGREGSIEEQSNLFGKTFQYTFDFKAVRVKMEEMARAAGYQFTYQVTPAGL
jgi:hypothetical protein